MWPQVGHPKKETQRMIKRKWEAKWRPDPQKKKKNWRGKCEIFRSGWNGWWVFESWGKREREGPQIKERKLEREAWFAMEETEERETVKGKQKRWRESRGGIYS